MDRRTLRLLDYQVPLKAQRSDDGIGKLDLLGMLGETRLAVIELKIQKTMPRRLAATPLRAFLEALAFAAIVEANTAEIAAEGLEAFGARIDDFQPAVVCMAPAAYWMNYLNNPRAGRWWPALKELSATLGQSLGLQTYFLSIAPCEFTMGTVNTRLTMQSTWSLADVSDIA